MEGTNEIKRTEIRELGEFKLIDHLTQAHQLQNNSSVRGIGDDAAIINNGKFLTVVSTDMLVEGIHFDLIYSPLKHLGYKAVVVNLSDIYAMNAIPKQITFSMALSSKFSVEAIEELYKGIYAACDRYHVDLVGGDTTSSNKGLILSVTAIGQVTAEKIALQKYCQGWRFNLYYRGCWRGLFRVANFGKGKAVISIQSKYSAGFRRPKLLSWPSA